MTVMMLSIALCCPWAEARGRNNNNNNGGGGNQPTQQAAPQSRGNQGNMGRGNGGNQGMGRGPQANQQQNRPQGTMQNQRPGNMGLGNMQTPGNQRPNNGGNGNMGNQRPNNGSNGFGNPGHGPGNNGFGPGANPGDWGRPHGIHFGTPYRPMMPANRPWAPPMRPAGYRPMGGPVISTILGVALGTALNMTLTNLINNGYNVTGYVNNAVYVADAMQLNLLWPNATLYYDNGGLAGSEFFYSTPYYSMNRYNNAYARLMNIYGAPYSVNNLADGGLQATWWGNGGQFIQLQFNTGVAANGTTRFFTTLSFGN